jgi:excisionase family DNA binding protein
MKQASEMARIPRNNIYYAVRNGLLPYEMVGRQYIFRKKDIEAYAMKYWGVRNEIRVG